MRTLLVALVCCLFLSAAAPSAKAQEVKESCMQDDMGIWPEPPHSCPVCKANCSYQQGLGIARCNAEYWKRVIEVRKHNQLVKACLGKGQAGLAGGAKPPTITNRPVGSPVQAEAKKVSAWNEPQTPAGGPRASERIVPSLSSKCGSASDLCTYRIRVLFPARDASKYCTGENFQRCVKGDLDPDVFGHPREPQGVPRLDLSRQFEAAEAKAISNDTFLALVDRDAAALRKESADIVRGYQDYRRRLRQHAASQRRSSAGVRREADDGQDDNSSAALNAFMSGMSGVMSGAASGGRGSNTARSYTVAPQRTQTRSGGGYPPCRGPGTCAIRD